MMRKSLSILISAVLLLTLAISASASSAFVQDDAGILSQDQIDSLNDLSGQLAYDYGFGVYVMTVSDYNEMDGAGSIEDAAKTAYLDYGLGEGENQAGILLLLSMDNRKYALYDHGSVSVFDRDAHEYLADQFLDEFGDDQWYEGFEDYVSACSYLLDMEANGENLGDNPPHFRAYGVTVCVILGFLVAFIVTGTLKSQLTSVSEKSGASDFIAGQGLELSVNTDIFTHRTVTRVYDPPQKDSSSGSNDCDSSSGSF